MRAFRNAAQNSRFGFTLIELLIVVAIIAILAAIAVPNFLEAQIRSKVSRVKADQRTIATALESYRTDNSMYPDYAVLFFEPSSDSPQTNGIGPCLSTPTAYLSSWFGVCMDPFNQTDLTQPWKRHYKYDSLSYYRIQKKTLNIDINDQPAWRILSYGPDQNDFAKYNIPTSEQWVYGTTEYDPTNGTLSWGDIWRSGPKGVF